MLAVIARVTPDVVDKARTLLGDLATASKARWGTGQLESTRAALDEEGAAAFGLPEPESASNDDSVPYALAWLNYWSDATCTAMGFPDTARPYDTNLKASGRRVGEGWIVALTPEPLDIRRDDHLRALREACERFDEIGGRAGYARHQQKLRVDEPTLYDETVRQLRHLLIARAHLARFEELRAPDIIADGTRETVEEREAAWMGSGRCGTCRTLPRRATAGCARLPKRRGVSLSRTVEGEEPKRRTPSCPRQSSDCCALRDFRHLQESTASTSISCPKLRLIRLGSLRGTRRPAGRKQPGSTVPLPMPTQ